MKKSEMLVILKDLKLEVNGEEAHLSLAGANRILTEIERVGMLPPTYTRNKSKFPGDINLTESNDWESEDEKV